MDKKAIRNTAMYSSLLGVLGIVGFWLAYKPNNTLQTFPATTFFIGDANFADANYRLQKTVSQTPLPYTFCILHENERTGTQAVYQFLREVGGAVWEVKSRGDRNVTFFIKKKKYTFDPNRIFTPNGIANTMVMLSRNPPTSEARSMAAEFAQRITDSLFSKSSTAMVSVHNNTDLMYSSLSHLPDSANADGVRDIYINTTRDPDDFFYVTRRGDFNHFKNLGYNVILQDNRFIKDDGSLSVYCGKRRIRYINIEAEFNHYAEQMDMLQAVHHLLKKQPAPQPVAMAKPKAADKPSESIAAKPATNAPRYSGTATVVPIKPTPRPEDTTKKTVSKSNPNLLEAELEEDLP